MLELPRVLFQGVRATLIEVTSASALLEFDSSFDEHKRLRLGKGWRLLVTFLTPQPRKNGSVRGRPRILTLEDEDDIVWKYHNTKGATVRSIGLEIGVNHSTVARAIQRHRKRAGKR